jgi:hypothetical protein
MLMAAILAVAQMPMPETPIRLLMRLLWRRIGLLELAAAAPWSKTSDADT